MVSNKFYFYVLLCADNSLYGGFTTNLTHRLAQHNAGKGAKYTRVRTRRPAAMIYHEQFATKRAALQAEYAFKHQTRAQKVAFLAAHNVEVTLHQR